MTSIPELTCPLHPDCLLTHFCLSDKCLKGILCSQCLPSHKKDHHIITLKQAFHRDVKHFEQLLATQHQLEDLQFNTLTQVKQIEKDLKDLFEKIQDRINDLFKRYKYNFQAYKKWLTDYKQSIKLLCQDSENSSEILPATLDLYKILKEKSHLITQSPKRGIDHFLDSMKFELEGFTATLKLLNESYYPEEDNFNDITYLGKRVIREDKGISLAGVPLGNMAAFSFGSHSSATKLGSLGLFQCNPSSIIQKNSFQTIEKNQISCVRSIEDQKCLITGSSKQIKIFALQKPTLEMKCLATLKRNQGTDFIYIKEEDLIVSGGRNPHLVIWKLNRTNPKRIGTFHSMDDHNHFCSMLSYIPSQKAILVVFTSSIEIISLLTLKIIKSIPISGLCSSLIYWPQREAILAGVIDKEVKVYMQDGCGEYYLERVIKTKGIPYSILTNDEGDQLLMATGRKFLELYDFKTNVSKQSKDTEMDIYHIVYLKNCKEILAGGSSNTVIEFKIMEGSSLDPFFTKRDD